MRVEIQNTTGFLLIQSLMLNPEVSLKYKSYLVCVNHILYF